MNLGPDVVIPLTIALVTSLIAPIIIERLLYRAKERIRASRTIRDDLYAMQSSIYLAAQQTSVSPICEATPELLIATTEDYRLLAPYVTGDVWGAVSGARRRWIRLGHSVSKDSAFQHHAEELHALDDVLEQARKGLSKKDRRMPYKPHTHYEQTRVLLHQVVDANRLA